MSSMPFHLVSYTIKLMQLSQLESNRPPPDFKVKLLVCCKIGSAVSLYPLEHQHFTHPCDIS